MTRALGFKDRQRALRIQQKLVRLHYPAAYDNLGWLIIFEQKNYSKAVELFRNGTRLGDPDAMVSLAEMVDKGRTVTLNPSETKLALYARAAQLGDSDAARALQVEQEKEIQQQEQRAIQFEQQRRAMEMFQGIVRGVLR
jgi:TPR repeat protein